MVRIFFATDVHGSDICWKKFIAGAKFYGAQVLVLGGDMTGKAIVPLVRDARGYYRRARRADGPVCGVWSPGLRAHGAAGIRAAVAARPPRRPYVVSHLRRA